MAKIGRFWVKEPRHSETCAQKKNGTAIDKFVNRYALFSPLILPLTLGGGQDMCFLTQKTIFLERHKALLLPDTKIHGLVIKRESYDEREITRFRRNWASQRRVTQNPFQTKSDTSIVARVKRSIDAVRDPKQAIRLEAHANRWLPSIFSFFLFCFIMYICSAVIWDRFVMPSRSKTFGNFCARETRVTRGREYWPIPDSGKGCITPSLPC